MRRTLLKARLGLEHLLRPSEIHFMMLWAALAGLFGALATIVFRDGLAATQWLLVGHNESLVEMATTLSWQMRVLIPTVGGMVAGVVLVMAKRIATPEPTDYMEAIAEGDGRLSVRTTLLRSLSSLCTIASGGSIGREGSMVQLAAMCASIIGRAFNFDARRLRLLVACGAAAGITAAYNAPIAGAFFVTEIILGSFAMESFGPVVVAAVVANITMRRYPGYHPTYEMPMFPDVSNFEVVLFVVLGVVAGFAAPQFLRLLALVKEQFQRSRLPVPLRLGISGLAVGIISIWVPQVWGNGYSVVNSMLHENWVWSAVATVLVFKLIATLLTAGSGAVGGIFTPTLFIGAAVGSLFGQAMQTIWPHAVSAPFTYAMVGMGAFLAAATRAPLMAIMMIFEMTLSYPVMLPLLLSCIVAYFIARNSNGASMYEVTAQRHDEEQARLRLRQTRMGDLIKPAETVLPPDASFEDMIAVFLRFPVKYVYIVDDANRLLGVVSTQALAAIMSTPSANTGKRAGDLMRQDLLQVITPEMTLDDGWQCFMAHQGERLPVVQSHENPVLLGAIYKSSLLDAYFKLGKLQEPLGTVTR